jgi:hypothetical protein
MGRKQMRPRRASGGGQTTTVTERILESYKEAFVPDFSPPYGIQQKSRGWITKKDWNLTDHMLRMHLEGNYWIGLSGRFYTRWIVIDIDAHTPKAASNIERLAESVLAAFPNASPLIFSTPGGGFHLWYFTDRTVWRDAAVKFAVGCLATVGIVPQPGVVEVYPTRGLIRAPLGSDCYFINPMTWLPVSFDRYICLDALHETLIHEKFDPLEIPNVPRFIRPPSTPITLPLPSDTGSSKFNSEVETLISKGLQSEGTRNDSLVKINWYLAYYRGWDSQMREAFLIHWMGEKHNEKSKDYNRDPEYVRKHIRQIVNHTKRSQRRAVVNGSDSGSPISDYVTKRSLVEREHNLLCNFITMALARGKSFKRGWIDVAIPSRTLKGWDWEYGPVRDSLIEKDFIRKGNNYGAQIGRCQSYFVKVPSTLN